MLGMYDKSHSFASWYNDSNIFYRPTLSAIVRTPRPDMFRLVKCVGFASPS
jgi:hypothetical protein